MPSARCVKAPELFRCLKRNLPTVGTRAIPTASVPIVVDRQWVARLWATRKSTLIQALVVIIVIPVIKLAGVTIDTPARSVVHNTISIAEIDLTTQEITKPVRYVKYDDMGVRYSVPEAEVDAFTYAVEAIQNAEWGSDERDALIDDFNARFGEFNVEHSEA